MIKAKKRLLSAALSILMVLMTFAGMETGGNIAPDTVSAAQTNWKFDLGGTPQSGYTAVSASQGFNASLGYGFRNTSGVKNVGASGKGALSDAVEFTDVNNANNTFDVNLPKGLYNVTVILGNTNRTSVYIEGLLQIVNMTGNNASHSLLIPVTDGQLNLRAAPGKEKYAYTISEVDISLVSEDPTLPPTVWMCGDSTVCNYYPLATSQQAGWGQVLSNYIPKQWQVRNMAASGQFAKGFYTSGQFGPIEYYGKPGDIYIISIGINDTNYSNAEEYYTVVTEMTKKAKAKGMRVILVKQQGRNGDADRKPLLTGRWFGGELDKIGAEQNVQVVDLFNLWQNYCISIGGEATTNLYMPSDGLHPNRSGAMKLAELAASAIDWDSVLSEGAEIDENPSYAIKNKNSGLYLTAEKAANGGNVSQQSKNGDYSIWTVKKSGSKGYYYIYSKLENGQYLLDLDRGLTANGTNIGVYQNTYNDAQLFKFIANSDGSYVITTKNSSDTSCVEVKNALTDAGGNVQEWEINGHACQSWILEKVEAPAPTQPDPTQPTSPSTQPSTAPTTAKPLEPVSGRVIGDLNGDNKVNIFDYMIMKRALKNGGKGVGRYNADINADGVIDDKDCSAVMQYLVRRNPSFEAVEKRSSFYYANEMKFESGWLESTNAGFKKDSYVNLDNAVGSYIDWEVYAPESGNYLCSFSIANGSASNRVMKIEVNNGSDYWKQDFLSTGAWTVWKTIGIVLPMSAGMNRIRMTSDMNEGGPNLDTLYMEKTDEPIAEPYDPNATGPGGPGGKHTVYIAGDSTVQTYRASYAPQQGWGAYLEENLPDGYTVSNHAIAGRSSKSFYDNGRLGTILDSIQAGDYLLVQFGINDSAASNAERYAPVSGKVPGTDGSFEFYIAKYIEGALAKGAKPILVTTVIGLKAYNNNSKKFEGSYGNYCDAMKRLASHYKIPCIDLNTLMVNHYNAIGYNAAYKYHLCSAVEGSTDMTHFTETGASAVAKLVAEELKKNL